MWCCWQLWRMYSQALVCIVIVRGQRPGWRHGKWIMGLDAPIDVQMEWSGKPPMFTVAPEKNKAPISTRTKVIQETVVRLNESTKIKIKPIDLGQPLWAIPKHRPYENVITGLALNYKESSHRAFVGSARRAGYKGDIVIVTEPLHKMQKSAAAFLQKMDVIAYPVNPNCAVEGKGGNIKHKTCHWRDNEPRLPLAIMRHVFYLAIACQYSPTSGVLILDYRDTFFQGDPFAAFRTKPLRGLDLVLVAEHYPFKQIGNCPFNGGWVRNCWGRDSFEAMGQQVVLCSGSYIGARDGVINFERSLLAEASAMQCHAKGVPSDQGYLNYLYYSGALPLESTRVEDRGYGVINTIGSLDGRRAHQEGFLPPTHVNIGQYWQIRDSQGFVLQNDKVTRSPVVHQYDRFHLEFRDFVAMLGKCDDASCYSSFSSSSIW